MERSKEQEAAGETSAEGLGLGGRVTRVKVPDRRGQVLWVSTGEGGW